MDSDKEKALSELSELSKEFTKAANDYQEECDNFFQSLPYDDKLKLFCAISRLIFKGEIEEKGSYRHVLYDTFQFGPDSYAVAQHAGYLSIHNAIVDGESIKDTIKDFVENHMDITDDNLDKQLDKFMLGKYL